MNPLFFYGVFCAHAHGLTAEVVKKTVNRITAAKDKYGCKLKKIKIANIIFVCFLRRS